MSCLIYLIYEIKGILIEITILIILKCIKNYKKKLNQDIIRFENLSPEEKKLFLITKFNTNINRDNPKEREIFIRQCKVYIYLIFSL